MTKQSYTKHGLLQIHNVFYWESEYTKVILESRVWITMAGNIKKHEHYQNLGYEIPRHMKKGKLIVNKKVKILVRVCDLTQNSGVIVTKICDMCGKIAAKTTYSSVMEVRKNGNGKDRCRKCASIRIAEIVESNIKHEDSLEFFAKTNNKTYLLDEYSKNNIKPPDKIFKFSTKKYHWLCKKCKSEYDMTLGNRTLHNCNCPYCSRQRVNDTNCLTTTHPHISELLVDEDFGKLVTSGSGRRTEFKCQNCGNIETRRICSVVKNGFSCSICSDGLSYPEKFMANILKQLNIKYEKEKIFQWSKNIKCDNEKLQGTKKYDFYIPSLNMIIETHGEQHYRVHKNFRGGLEFEKENDKLKEEIAKANGIEEYIVINCSLSSMNYIRNNVIKSDLSRILDLINIDWSICNKFACSSFMKNACDLWKTGKHSVKEIAKILNLNDETIRTYLRKGTKIGWCHYDPQKEIEKNNKSRRRSILQLSKDGKIIKYWNSISEASINLNIRTSGIGLACKGVNKTAGGFKWIYND